MTDHDGSSADAGSFTGAKLLLTCDDALLTCLRDDFAHIPFPAHWDLPGGGREGLETPLQCGLRELNEEFGLVLPPDRLAARAFASVQFPGRFAWLLSGRITHAEVASIRFGDEGQEWRMMPLAEYLSHPRAVPHFPGWIRTLLGDVSTACKRTRSGQNPVP
ncbi:NUDIX domain-containing protein [Paracoccus sp. M683]|uniref:NUDIX hydrolase n=1 Tax=Paracoccus sp. M683 TaxID=2594268 RepID=UPI00117C3A42|nr:NUDIX hydrolase [Paracoccus sp. M683]TRW95944.1 NUDIX domain-containing protein [Paracoccus sp. M683]